MLIPMCTVSSILVWHSLGGEVDLQLGWVFGEVATLKGCLCTIRANALTVVLNTIMMKKIYELMVSNSYWKDEWMQYIFVIWESKRSYCHFVYMRMSYKCCNAERTAVSKALFLLHE